jgi:hypothetical protein
MEGVSCSKFAVAAQDQEQAIQMALADKDSDPPIIAGIRLQAVTLDKPAILIESQLRGEACAFSGAQYGSVQHD